MFYLIETFCIVNTQKFLQKFLFSLHLIETFCIVNYKLEMRDNINIKFNRNILYCKYKSDMLNKSNTINLIETFCIVLNFI